jgi:phage recombination protein Bet
MSSTPQQTESLALAKTSPLIIELAAQWKMSAVTMINTLKATVFPQSDTNGKPLVVTDAQLMVFLQVCHEYQLNPFTREIYAFPTRGGGIVPMVPVDGWANIVNRNPQMNGVKFIDDWVVPDPKKPYDKSLFSTTAIIYRKDREHPTEITEYMAECCLPNKDPWKRWPARMLRHKAFIQCARIAFSLAGIFDPDEAERIAESEEPKKEPITRPSRQIEGTTTTASAATTEPQAEAAKVEGAKPSPQAASCLCECCKDENCACVGKSEFDQCGCPACKKIIEDAKKSKVESQPAQTAGAQASQQATQQVSGSELFPPEGQTSTVVYAPHEKLKKLFAVARSVFPEKPEDKLHEFLLQKYQIKSVKEIPVDKLPEIVAELGKALKAK